MNEEVTFGQIIDELVKDATLSLEKVEENPALGTSRTVVYADVTAAWLGDLAPNLLLPLLDQHQRADNQRAQRGPPVWQQRLSTR